MKTVRIITLGCAKNEVDSEEIAGVLANKGFRVNATAEFADVTVINTCGFLQAARDEGIATIRAAVKEKRSGKTGKVIVAGCLAQRMGKDIAKLAPGADAYVGVGHMERFDEIVELTMDSDDTFFEIPPPHHRWASIPTRARSGAPWSAYLKISEGCDHKCTFCTIPSFRGMHQSKPIERVESEAKHLARTGVREINLIAQDVTQYGYDLYKEFTLPKLLGRLNDVEGIEWIRLLYFYPNRLTDEVIDAMANLDKVLPYIDIPLQHVHPDVLRSMKRPWDGDRYLKILEKLRLAMPDCAIRTTFIVGFPGETERHFDYLLDWMKDATLDRVGAFMFSREAGTPAYDLPNQVPAKVKRSRYDRLMKTQQLISLEKNRSWIGKRIQVLIEQSADENWMSGRSFRDAPEIDGLVFVQGTEQPGEIIETEVTDAEEYDLYARPIRRVVNSRKKAKPLRVIAPSNPL
jgi:ribosomal protein S12 methylthiotransferase